MPCQLSLSTDIVVNGARCFSTGSVLNGRNLRAGVSRITIGRNLRLTYEEAQGPEKIGVTKTWNSWNTSKEKTCICSGGSRISCGEAPAATFRKICMSKQKNRDLGGAPDAPPPWIRH